MKEALKSVVLTCVTLVEIGPKRTGADCFTTRIYCAVTNGAHVFFAFVECYGEFWKGRGQEKYGGLMQRAKSP